MFVEEKRMQRTSVPTAKIVSRFLRSVRTLGSPCAGGIRMWLLPEKRPTAASDRTRSHVVISSTGASTECGKASVQ
jgi:hypothetical protein